MSGLNQQEKLAAIRFSQMSWLDRRWLLKQLSPSERQRLQAAAELLPEAIKHADIDFDQVLASVSAEKQVSLQLAGCSVQLEPKQLMALFDELPQELRQNLKEAMHRNSGNHAAITDIAVAGSAVVTGTPAVRDRLLYQVLLERSL